MRVSSKPKEKVKEKPESNKNITLTQHKLLPPPKKVLFNKNNIKSSFKNESSNIEESLFASSVAIKEEPEFGKIFKISQPNRSKNPLKRKATGRRKSMLNKFESNPKFTE
mmetsp:Transcript_9325/g.8236  ORF Transcript_9325/g.8236 Transcript_9325/m.8236 type:complete len:110 (+) Transcript_9325:172-501(+)